MFNVNQLDEEHVLDNDITMYSDTSLKNESLSNVASVPNLNSIYESCNKKLSGMRK